MAWAHRRRLVVQPRCQASSVSSAVLEVIGLRKSFGETVAVKDATFTVGHGTCYGLIGPNGAGKTTAISIITGTVDADGGKVLLDGEQVSTNNPGPKRKIGYVPQDIALYTEISALDNLRFFGSLLRSECQHLENRIEYGLELTASHRSSQRTDCKLFGRNEAAT